ncbi:MAG: molybdopterin-dependent oxidoreductase [Intrasporangium sp.]|uniref:molybdopterin-dependent oxidoreductase n=1 Tax=Intrasporangium sp. TaxID=1925024 RepID=UPI002648B86A|nr:molybdopterin-dependent oxidoreductase [Intrasporangium sp.]MDN5797688.1 molybdopterin-dependent oxidoreductase [Intrasporangium sp.]
MTDGGPAGALTSDGQRRPPVLSAIDGIVAGLLTTGIATLLAALMTVVGASGGQPSPVAAVAGAFIDRTPPWLKDFAVTTFGTHDKLALLVGMLVVLTVICAAVGVLLRWRVPWALTAFALVGGIGLVAVLSRPGASPTDAVPTIVGVLVGLWYLARGTQPTPPAVTTNPTRRLVLGTIAGGTAAYIGSTVGGHAARATASRTAAVGPLRVASRVSIPAGADLKVPGLAPFIVPNDAFYRIDTAFVVPRIDADSWRLRVTGMVDREVEIDWNTLQDKEMTEALVTLTCVSNEVGGDLVGNATWTGWPVRDLLAMAGPRAGADMVLQTSADGFTCGTPLGALTDDRNALLAVRMNGQPLPFEHGFPVRVVVPGLYGYVSACKWVTELKVTTFAADEGYWTPRGWAARGPVKTESRIDVPRTGSSVPAGRVAIAGVAWAQHRGISRVEVQLDDGPWQQARLAADASTDAWRQWVLQWDAPRGSHTIRVRATDGTGQVQTATTAPPAPDGASGWHTVTVRVQ